MRIAKMDRRYGRRAIFTLCPRVVSKMYIMQDEFPTVNSKQACSFWDSGSGLRGEFDPFGYWIRHYEDRKRRNTEAIRWVLFYSQNRWWQHFGAELYGLPDDIKPFKISTQQALDLGSHTVTPEQMVAAMVQARLQG